MRHGFITRLRLALRIAAREASRNRLQSALIALLVILPVAATTALLTVAESRVPTRSEIIQSRLGADAAALLEVVSPPDQSLAQQALDPESWTVERDARGDRVHSDPSADAWLTPEDVLPPDTAILPIEESLNGIVTETNDRRSRLLYVEGEVWNPALEGAYSITTGRAPRDQGEVLVTDATLDQLQIAVGDAFEVVDPSEALLTVVGTVDAATTADNVSVVFAAAGTVPGAMTDSYSQRYVLPERALSWEEVRDLNQAGIIAWSRDVINDPPSGSSQSVFDPRQASFGIALTIAAFAVMSIIVLAGAAFTIGARRRQHSLALMSSIGASRSTLFRIVAGDGLIIGVSGTLLGIAVGLTAALLWWNTIDNGDRLKFPGFHINVSVLITIGLIAVMVCWFAAVQSALAASRVDPAEALRGASRPPSRHRRTHRLGIPSAVVGCGVIVACGIGFSASLSDGSEQDTVTGAVTSSYFIGAVGGVLMALLGIVLTMPILLRGITRALTRAPLCFRLASREITSDPRRTTPVVAVVTLMVTVATFSVSTAFYLEQRIERTAILEAPPGRIPIQLVSPDAALTVEEAQDRSAEALSIAKQRLEVNDARLLSRPAQDWSGFWTNTGLRQIVALPNPDLLCPNAGRPDVPGTTPPRSIDDPRCDLDTFQAQAFVISGYGPGVPSIVIGSPEDIAFVLDRELTADQRTLLEGGGALTLWPELITDDTVTIATQEGGSTPDDVRTIDTAVLPAQVVNGPRLYHQVFLTPEGAQAIGLTPAQQFLLIGTPTPPSQAQLDGLWSELNTLIPGISQIRTAHDPTAEPAAAASTALALSTAVALSAGLLSIGLSWIEGLRTRRTLWSLGASPHILRSVQATQIALIVGTGALAGVMVGLLPGLALFVPTDSGFTPPWVFITLTVVLLPVLLALIATMFPTGLPTPHRRQRRKEVALLNAA